METRNRNKVLLTLAATAMFLCASGGATQAAIFTWNGDHGSSNKWNKADNWVDDIALVSSVDSDVVFNAPGAARLNNMLSDSFIIGSLEFNANATSAVNIQLRNSNNAHRTLTLGSATVAPTITVQSSGVVTHVIGSTARGSVILGNNLTVTIDGATGTELAIGRAIKGGYGITKKGTGVLNFNAANTYTGGTTLSAGTLALGSGGSINDSSSVSIGAGAIFDVSAKSSYAMSGLQPFTFVLEGDATGSAGLLEAAGLDISSAIVDFNIVNPLDDSVYVLAEYTGLTGEFASATAPTGYAIDYAYNGGTQIALTATAIPEPSSLALLWLGLSSLFFARFRHRR